MILSVIGLLIIPPCLIDFNFAIHLWEQQLIGYHFYQSHLWTYLSLLSNLKFF